MARLYTYDEQGIYVPCKVHILGDEAEKVKQNDGPAYIYLTGPPGSYNIEVRHPGYKIARERIELIAVDSKNANQTDELDNKLQLLPK